MTEEPNAYRIEVVVPLLPIGQISELFEVVANAVHDWVPEDRNWDPFITGTSFYDELGR